MTEAPDHPNTMGDATEQSGLVPPKRFDIVIGGGGLAGNLMALALSGSLGTDADIAIVDPTSGAQSSAKKRVPTLREDPRCSSIAAGSKALLDAVGVWSAIAPHAQPISRIALTDTALESPVRIPRMEYDNRVEDPFSEDLVPGSYIVPNALMGAAVLDAISQVRSVTRIVARIQAVDVDTGGCRLETDAGTITAPLVIAADGARSSLRRAANIRNVVRDHRQCAIVTVVSHSLPHDGVAVQHFLPGGPFAILPLTGNKSCVTWSERAREAARIVALDDHAFHHELERRFGGQLGEITLESGRTTFPLQTQLAHEMIAPRLALIGDAAHAVHPIAGQGLNLAIRDIAALTECVVDGMRVGLDPGDATGLERYQRWRRFDAAMSAMTFAGLNRLFSNDNGLLRSARDFGLGFIDRMPGVKQRLVNEAAGLTGDVPKLLRGELV